MPPIREWRLFSILPLWRLESNFLGMQGTFERTIPLSKVWPQAPGWRCARLAGLAALRRIAVLDSKCGWVTKQWPFLNNSVKYPLGERSRRGGVRVQEGRREGGLRSGRCGLQGLREVLGRRCRQSVLDAVHVDRR